MNSKKNPNMKKTNKLMVNAIAKKRFTSRMAKRLAKQLDRLGISPHDPLGFIAEERDKKRGGNKDGIIRIY